MRAVYKVLEAGAAASRPHWQCVGRRQLTCSHGQVNTGYEIRARRFSTANSSLSAIAPGFSAKMSKSNGRTVASLEARSTQQDLFGRTTTPAYHKTRLQAALNPPSSSTSPKAPNPTDVLAATLPLLDSPDLQSILDPHLSEISSVLFTCEDSEEVERVLSYCWSRSQANKVQVTKGKKGPADHYAAYLIRQASVQSQERLTTLSTSLDMAIQRHHPTKRLPAPIWSAWAFLRAKTNQLEPNTFMSTMPPALHLFKYIEALVGKLDPEIVARISALSAVIDKGTLPLTLDELQVKLTSLKGRGDTDGIQTLWSSVRSKLQTAPGDQQGILSLPNRADLLASFLNILLRPGPSFDVPQKVKLEVLAHQVMTLLPRPIPLQVHHTLLATRAKLDETTLSTGSELRSLDDEAAVFGGPNRETALANLHAAWALVVHEGIAKDVKLYMLYMEGLGRLGDIAGLQRAWNEFVVDEACKELYLKEKKGESYSSALAYRQVQPTRHHTP
jgi:hypothetical protein